MKPNLQFCQLVIPCALLLFFPGCISVARSPSPHFYSLEPIQEAGNAALSDTGNLNNALVGVGPVSLPEYLNRPQIVTRNSDSTIEFAQFDRWAEHLDRALARILAQNLSILLPGINVEIFPWNGVLPIRYQVLIDVIRLDCSLDGETVLLMQWSVLDAKEKRLLLSRRSEYREPPSKAHGYSGIVQALSAICGSSSREIAQALSELKPPAKPLRR